MLASRPTAREEKRLSTPITASSPLMIQSATSRVTPPNSEERPMKRKRATPKRLDPSGGEKKRKTPTLKKKRGRGRKNTAPAAAQNEMKTAPSSSVPGYYTYSQEPQAPAALLHGPKSTAGIPMAATINNLIMEKHGRVDNALRRYEDAKKSYEAALSTVDSLSQLDRKDTAAKRSSDATSEYPIVMGRPVMPGSGGVKFEFTRPAGLAYRGNCGPKTGQYLRSTNELSSIPFVSAGEGSTDVGGEAQRPYANAPLHYASMPQQPSGDEPWTSTPRTRTLFDLPLLSPPPSVAMRASTSTSPWYAQSMTPQRQHCIRAPMTPTWMPAVTTPKRLTESAKAFADALHESSPLAMLASAAGMESSHGIMGGGGVYAIHHPDTTPGLVESAPSSGGTPTAYSKPPMPAFPVSMPPIDDGEFPNNGSAAVGSKGGGVAIKRYNIRPKELRRTDIAAATATNTAAVDLLFERPTLQHPSFFTGPVLRAPRSTLPLLGGGAQFTSGATA